ncbi:hypothetical protein LQF61_08445 [Tetragenococcus koreensis]|uniref:Uncharacterized protein n=1 Tax=Tetragenococcus koreensis TaxID=290335 RepID=A0AAN4UBM1_9ENTE|nr:hypothetical protein [Tetragenococcus koreensis]MCF1585448.1 hypothetical protein [Tetragenococcus koreensis]MCF1614994.1 hypothetical protein [Tetragenococcus koreensis]MCF1620104.1 hypothetical protein [Tetragenococcus koreensis]MCF1624822.1 hypothetical protein [Tetragenococcus koreensis]MCF1629714.1 hypothetical protein [Tetragenococcus koreensis]
MTTIDKPKSKIIELNGRYEIYYCLFSQSNSNNKKDYKKETSHILKDLHLAYEQTESYDKNIKDLNCLLKVDENSFFKNLSDKEEAEERLAANHIKIFGQRKDSLYKVSILFPIINTNGQNIDYFFPVVYHFKDNRKIFKFTFDFNEKDIAENYSINKTLVSIDYFYRKAGKLIKQSKQECQLINNVFNEVYKKYCVDMTPVTNFDFQYEPLYATAYILNFKLDRFSEKERSAWLYYLTLSPSYTSISKEYTDKPIEFNGLSMYVTPQKAFLSGSTQLENELRYRDTNETDNTCLNSQPENNYFAYASTFYPMLFKIILKKYKLFFLEKNELSLTKIMKKKRANLKHSYIFTILETDLAFANYDSVSKISQQLESLIIPAYISKQIDELDYFRQNYENGSINSYIEKNNNFFAFITFILSIFLSYPPIKEVLTYLNVGEYSLIAYAILNIGALLYYVVYRLITKWRN